MPSVRFADVLLESTPRALAYPGLYHRSDRPVVLDEAKGEWVLDGSGTFDFSTFFNSLSVMKLREYTTMTGAVLRLELKGAACTVRQTMGDAFARDPMHVDGAEVQVPAARTWKTVELPLRLDDDMVVVGFEIETQGPVRIRNGHYDLEVGQEPRDVELALVSTTFRKEDYITGNVALVKRNILEGDADIARHFHMYVIDNGRTLDPADLDGPGVTVIPNDNVGGSGGFTRGILAAMDQEPRATHVLLMDDDVSISTESIVRTYNLLRIVKDRYRDAIVSGAMMNFDFGEDQWEDTGFATPEGTFAPCKPQLRMTQFRNVVYNETYTPAPDMERHNRYAGWWFAAIPMDLVDRKGLPLPLFVRGDDSEFGIRCDVDFLTMNALCVWHMAFDEKYDPAVERYQVPRNSLIIQAMGAAPDADFMKALYHNIHLELKKFGYDNAELCLDAFEDYLKGPRFLEDPDRVRDAFMKAHRNKEQLVDLADLQRMVECDPELEGLDLRRKDPLRIAEYGRRSFLQRATDFVTDNGQRFLKQEGESYAVIPIMGWMYPAEAIRGKHKLVVVDWYNRQGAIRVRDNDRYRSVLRRYRRDLNYYKAHRDRLLAEYRDAFPRLTSVGFWKEYLHLG